MRSELLSSPASNEAHGDHITSKEASFDKQPGQLRFIDSLIAKIFDSKLVSASNCSSASTNFRLQASAARHAPQGVRRKVNAIRQGFDHLMFF